MHIVVIGAGQAAASCIAKLRSEGFDGDITLIGAEQTLPYQRPPLSKGYLLGEMPLERLLLRAPEWYEENRVTVKTGMRATGIRPDLKQVELEAQERIDYDALVLCTGAHPRGLSDEQGGMLDHVFTIRDLADVDAMEPSFQQDARLLVVGGGYIGLEAAAVAAKRGMLVTLIEAAPRILGRVACAETASFIRELHEYHGVDIREGVSLERLLGEESVTGAVLSDGTTFDLECAVVGIGVTPATVLADAAGLQIDNGIAVNEQGVSSDPHIWAAGDCASFPHAGTRLRLESVGNAIDMGELVACNILGANAEYHPKPWFWSDQYDCKLQIAGLNTGYDAVHTRIDGAARSHWYYKNAQLIAVDAMNDPRAYMVGKRLIEAGKSAAPDRVTDPTIELKALLQP